MHESVFDDRKRRMYAQTCRQTDRKTVIGMDEGGIQPSAFFRRGVKGDRGKRKKEEEERRGGNRGKTVGATQQKVHAARREGKRD